MCSWRRSGRCSVSVRVAFAGGGKVQPPGAKAKGYSLIEMAAITAYYNSYFIAFGPSPSNPPPDVPMQILVADATVSRGTWFYVPVYYADDAGGAAPGFPADIDDQTADAEFLENAVLTGYGISTLVVAVDGKITCLDGRYISGVTSPVPLVDGSPPGSHYICSAAFLTPLKPGGPMRSRSEESSTASRSCSLIMPSPLASEYSPPLALRASRDRRPDSRLGESRPGTRSKTRPEMQSEG